MKMENNLKLEMSFDDILFQLSKGNTIEGLKKGRRWFGLHQVKDWKNQFGYKFHIYSNDHLIDNKPHFHLIKESENIDCKIFFTGEISTCKGVNKLEKKVKEALDYFLSKPRIQALLVDFWNDKNPDLKITL
jgi:hypothetical protein